MKDMANRNLTFESFTQHVIDELHRQCDVKVAEEILGFVEDKEMIEELYDKGVTVGKATQTFIDDYNAYYGVSQR